jgi:gamma-glutamylcyclotransferase (GGCT)/AIG2-like uncharacterized protein YtfP
MAYLFVYGTLLNDVGHQIIGSIAAKMQLGDHGQTSGALYDLGEYPALVETGNIADVVKGEVYIITDAQMVFDVLDEYEGVNDTPALYSRKLKPVTLSGGQVIDCWVYVYQQPVEEYHLKIEGGNYITHRNSNMNSI